MLMSVDRYVGVDDSGSPNGPEEPLKLFRYSVFASEVAAVVGSVKEAAVYLALLLTRNSSM
jgi:hypothetical protein